MTSEVTIGKTNVQTTKLGLGTNKVGGHNLFPGLKDEDGYALVKQALDAGVQLIDTAHMYGEGRSEEIIGDVIQGYDRSKIVIATKGAQDANNGNKPNNAPAFLKQAVEDSLKRLKTDYIDIFYIHFPDQDTPKGEAVAALNELKEEGKIRAIGVSNFSLDQIKEANKNNQVDIVEDHYSLVYRAAEKEEWAYLKEHQISFVPYFPLASGLLTGKYTSADYSKFEKQYSQEQFAAVLSALDQVKAIADEHQVTVAQTILAWYMANTAITAVIPGARNADQVAANLKATDVTLSAVEFETIDQAFAAFK
ncbi:aldo/keto reductase [Fructobacillus pseudoficulneus]|uniref:Aldo/keto reductase n=1 Tax=Fructobacillus pseudoficulneus TaxID=220714 RepID=A0A3F3GRL2_9LACO|nr:aldo/keto reductase [Fructobacillus pseudoficulneus]GAP02324.1 aldo/keto reductase [Fructobacillus pseudoficulneus]SEH36387.1 Predicted oxidoreductase [Fructobacillus pseudoficulneus]